MTMTYQEQHMLQAATGRAAILDLTARHNRPTPPATVTGWIATFRHSGARFSRDRRDVHRSARGIRRRRRATPGHRRSRDHSRRRQRDPALCRFAFRRVHVWRHHPGATGTYRDQLIYERGGWYFTSRDLEWDSVPSRHQLSCKRLRYVDRLTSATSSPSAPTRMRCAWSARRTEPRFAAPRSAARASNCSRRWFRTAIRPIGTTSSPRQIWGGLSRRRLC